MNVLLSFSLLLGVFSVWLLIRNEYVFKFRKSLRQSVKEACNRDFQVGVFEFEWRYRKLDAVSYDRMVYQFWKPLRIESFYDNSDFILPKETLYDRRSP